MSAVQVQGQILIHLQAEQHDQQRMEDGQGLQKDKEVPAATEVECGNYRDHDLEGAKLLAQKWVDGINTKGWNCYK